MDLTFVGFAFMFLIFSCFAWNFTQNRKRLEDTLKIQNSTLEDFQEQTIIKDKQLSKLRRDYDTVTQESNRKTQFAEKEVLLAKQSTAEERKEKNLWKATAKEKHLGFPTLLSQIEKYEALKDGKIEKYLDEKHAPKAKEIVTVEMEKRRKAETELGISKNVISFYESLIPTLPIIRKEFPNLESEELIGYVQKVKGIFKENEQLKHKISSLNDNILKTEEEKASTKNKIVKLREELERVEEKARIYQDREATWRKSLRERSSGFPTLLKEVDNYIELQDQAIVDELVNKDRPALVASARVKEETMKRRIAERKLKHVNSIIEYYELMAPFLVDYKNEIFDDTEFEEVNSDYTDEEKQDEVTSYLVKEEYRKLTATERNQLALNRFWQKQKSKRMIGKIYERYVGYLHETKGYDVNYQGIIKGYEDLGRDLICTGPEDIVVIQCKNWAQYKTIYEKHIFQFFGTVFEYRDKFPRQNVRGVFYTSTQLSDLARRFAHKLNIELKERFPLDIGYPSIKCNIAKDGEKIYHLPFDQQYDKVKITLSKGESYCKTVLEAEEAGFRRAKRYAPVASA